MTYREEPTGSPVWRATRIVVPWVALILVVMVAWALLSDYRVAARHQASQQESSEEATTTAEIPADQPYVRVLSDGLNLRAEPSTASNVVVVLNAEERLVFVEETTGWYHVRRTDGTEGWVAAGGRYTELVRP
jgi:N-acetylmuramoyl-L-alanine amidase